MITVRSAVMAAVGIVLVMSQPARATLIGSQVTGALYFVGFPQNYFDPVNGHVPAGYLNVAGTTVTISSNAVEYGFADGTATITADFTGMQLTITDIPQFTAHYNPLQMVFTNSAFSNLATVSDSFPNGGMTGSLSGGVITWPASSIGFSLQRSSILNPANWVNVTNTPVVTNGLNQVMMPPPAGRQ